MRITRIPLNYMPEYTNHEHVGLPFNLEERLQIFANNYFIPIDSTIKIGYNAFEIMIETHNIGDWDKRKHELFLKNFPNIILYHVEKLEQITNNNIKYTFRYHYISRFVKEKWNDYYRLSFDSIMVM